MNIANACELLDIDKTKMNEITLRKQYHLKALEYHHDKCKDKNASEKFKDIKEAYEYLKENKKWYTDDIYETTDDTVEMSSYESLVRYFT